MQAYPACLAFYLVNGFLLLLVMLQPLLLLRSTCRFLG